MRRMLWVLAAVVLAGCEDVVKVKPGTDLVAVRDQIRAWRSANAARANEKVTVELAAGRYELSAPLALGPEDSHVEWGAAAGAEVRIAGGVLVETHPEAVTDREILERLPEKARAHVVAYDLHKLGIDDWGDYLYNSEDAVQRRVANTWGQGEFIMGSHPPPADRKSLGRMELFVDDAPLTVARSAKGVVYHTDKLLGTMTKSHLGLPCSPEGRFTYKEDLPAGWVKEADPHACGCWCRDWAEQHQRIVRLDPATKTMELSQPYHQYKYKAGAYFFGFNMLCELDEPGEWYIHRKTGQLIVWLPEGARGPRRVELSMASRLFELTGAQDVSVQGVTFETCRNSAVRMKDCTDCRLDDCTVRNVGQHALVVEDGERCGARDCRFYGMGGGGAWLVDGNRATLKSSGHFIEGCDIHDFGRWNRMYRPGVCLAGVGMRAERNRIHDSPHAAVLYFGCNLTMRSNEVYRVCSGSRDCGAFYSGRSWMLRGNRIEGNYIHDVIGLNGAFTRTIYLDDSIAQVEIVGNRFERCTWAIFVGGARECVITNNVFVDCPGALYVDKRGTNWQKPHIDGRLRELEKNGTVYGLSCRKGPYVDAFPAVKELPGPNPYEPVKNVIAHNRFIRGKAEWIEKYAPKLKNDPRWWRSGEVKDEDLVKWGVFADNEVDNAGLNETDSAVRTSDAEYEHVIHPGRDDGSGFWNERAKWFMYAPAFPFKRVPGAVKYRFTVTDTKGGNNVFVAEKPTAALSPVWARVNVADVTVVCEGLDASGDVVGTAGERTFWKAAGFKSGKYPLPDRDLREAARRVYAYVFNKPATQYLLDTGRFDLRDPINSYAAKNGAALIRAMTTYARLDPARRARALAVAEKAADYLISISQPAGTPLEYLVPTYAGPGESNTGIANADKTMVKEPAGVVSCFLDLAKATGKAKYRDLAIKMGETFLRLQGEDGTWYLKVFLKDAKPCNPNRLLPIEMIGMLEKLYAETGRTEFRAAADRAFDYVNRERMESWNWEGQFEDIPPSKPYQNLTKHPACSMAICLGQRFPGDKARIAQMRELLRFAEDQFVCWEKPCDGGPVRHFSTWHASNSYAEWLTPCALEQYACYWPIDASAIKLIRTYVALYKAEGKAVDLEKAKVLAASVLKVQRADGSIPTWWFNWDGKTCRGGNDWQNCMVASAAALAELGELIAGR